MSPSVRRLLADLGIVLPTGYAFGNPRVKKQADADLGPVGRALPPGRTGEPDTADSG